MIKVTRVCVVGGGPAGMTAAYSASSYKDTNVVLLEKMERTGRKLLITGKGRCNITNDGDLDSYMENIPNNGRFLYSAFSEFNNRDIIELLNRHGIKTKIERGKRVFPASDKASEVAGFFSRLLNEQKVEVKCDESVKKITKNADIFEIRTEKNIYFADAVILATGGLSYTKTGSTGDGYRLAREMGHSVTKLYPSLAAFKVLEKETARRLEGLSLRNVGIKLRDQNNKTVYEDFGEMVFTGDGISGPVILSASARIADRLPSAQFILNIDLKPALDEKKLDIRLVNDFNKNRNKDLINAMDELLPKSLIPVIIDLSGIMPHKKVNEITKSERRAIASIMKALRFTITGSDGFDNAIITRGGVCVNEINPKTLESKLVSGLYFAGELIDVDAYTGGFNLQIAFSTGFLAGKSAANRKTRETITQNVGGNG